MRRIAKTELIYQIDGLSNSANKAFLDPCGCVCETIFQFSHLHAQLVRNFLACPYFGDFNWYISSGDDNIRVPRLRGAGIRFNLIFKASYCVRK
mmetsp:Transcript_29262/g.58796  ORF Transcript_29262/g.58796 Transcript_29262/m.58796 type:complete len:94 (-) Transcript_29262:104-385(-)